MTTQPASLHTETAFRVLIVGRGSKSHHDLNRAEWCQRSAFLKDQLERVEAQEAISGISEPVLLEGCEPASFFDYATCVSLGQWGLPDFKADDYSPFIRLLHVYNFAFLLRDHTSANIAIDGIVREAEESGVLPNSEEIAYVLDSTGRAGNPMWKLFIDYRIHETPCSTLVALVDDTPSVYKGDVALAL